MKKPVIKCSECGKRLRNPQPMKVTNWNCHYDFNGKLVRVVCPNCQTPSESVDAELNAIFKQKVGTDGRHITGIFPPLSAA